MSKVLVDRELLEYLADLGDEAIERMGSYLAEKHGEQKYVDAARAILAQPAEAEGVEAPVVATLLIDEVFHGSHGPEAGDWDIEHNPGVTEKLAEQFPGEAFDLVRQVDHLAAISAVTAERDRLRDQVKALRLDAVRWRYVRLQGDDTHWLNLLRVDLDEFGGNINAAVDALIDGEAPAMAAKEA